MITMEDKKIIEQCNECYMLGVLAGEEDLFPGVGEENKNITLMKNSDNIVFYIKPISDEPIPILNKINRIVGFSNLYIGIDIHQSPAILPFDYKFKATRDKEMILKEKLTNNLIIFKPKISYNRIREQYFKNLEIVFIEDKQNLNLQSEYMNVPKINLKHKDFEERLMNGMNIVFEDYKHVMLAPEYVLCGDYLYYNFHKWDKNPNDKTMWKYQGGNETDLIKKIKINNDDEINNKIIKATDSFVFIDRILLDEIAMSRRDYESVTLDSKIIDKDKDKDKDEDKDEIMSFINFTENDNDECHFLKGLKDYTVQKNLSYNMEDLINFHICVKTNPLTIISGSSGTGKSQLALCYAKMLSLSEEDGNLLFLPITPTYTEPGDLLGFLNHTNGLFAASETQLTDFLIKAQNYPDKLFMVIFDEMNLSQVEHWFAPFISLLEVDSQQRKLLLYSEKSNCINKESYPHSIKIGDNIVFIGTVNVDETTKDFSDRLLDRANIVTLQKNSFSKLKKEQEEKKNDREYEKYMCQSFIDYSDWRNNDKFPKPFEDIQIKFFDQLNKLLEKYDEQKGVSFRNLKKIGDYINNIPKKEDGSNVLSVKKAIDLQVKQRVITKLKGTDRRFGALIGSYSIEEDTVKESELLSFLEEDRFKQISDFEVTKKEIKRKAKELSLYGYTN